MADLLKIIGEGNLKPVDRTAANVVPPPKEKKGKSGSRKGKRGKKGPQIRCAKCGRMVSNIEQHLRMKHPEPPRRAGVSTDYLQV